MLLGHLVDTESFTYGFDFVEEGFVTRCPVLLLRNDMKIRAFWDKLVSK